MATVVGISQAADEEFFTVVYDDGVEVHVAKQPGDLVPNARGTVRLPWDAIEARANAGPRLEVDEARGSGLIGERKTPPGRTYTLPPDDPRRSPQR